MGGISPIQEKFMKHAMSGTEELTTIETALDWMESYHSDGGLHCDSCPGKGREPDTDPGSAEWCQFAEDGNVAGCLGPVPSELPNGVWTQKQTP
jgi:hypothetical protein